jgi:pseudouridine-5'-phosphate glycosidase
MNTTENNKLKTLTMKNLETLKEQVRLAKTANSEGRQLVANSCKELYNIIEEDLYNKYGEVAVNDAYKDLCNGNFAEPFLCEKMKEKFELYANILPKK